MNGPFKPLLPLGGVPVLERCVRMFRNAGVEDVVCVTGHNHDRLSGLLKRLEAREVVNSRYEEGMFSSVKAGVGALDSDCAAFFILPVDIPLVRHETVRTLLGAWNGGDDSILYPVFNGMRGHPPLIPTKYAGDLFKWEGNGGLRAYLEQYESRAVEVPVADACMLMDMDTPEDYERIRRLYAGYRIPGEEECRALMADVLKVDKGIIDHCRAVAEVAAAMGKEINDSGGKLNLELITASALLHDLARDQSRHAVKGAWRLRKMGFPEVADIVAVHMDIGCRDGSQGLKPGVLRSEGRKYQSTGVPVSEAELVFLADKLVEGSKKVTLEERFVPKMEKFGKDLDVLAAILRRYTDAMIIQKKIGDFIDRDLSDAARRNSNGW